LKIGVMTVKYGIPYFANYLSTGWKKGDIRSMCCRLMLDLRELKQNITGGLFGSSDKTGSIGVVTINLPRIGYLAKDDADFFERLDYLIDLARASLEIKRTVVEKNLKRGLYPVSSQFLQKFDTYFSTIGIVGMHECCLNYLGKGIETVDGFEFALRVSKYIREKVKECQRETGTLFNYEATPAESCAYRLALLDKKKLGIDLWNGREPIYTSSTMLPANHDLDFWDAVRHQEPLQTLYTGGTVFHIWANIVVTLSDGWRCDMTDRYMNARGCIELVNEVFQKSKLPYVTITPTFGVCPVHGYLGPILDKCPDCGREVNVYSRVVGYVRPVKQWNPGKQEEFRKRKKLLDVSLEV
jgi:anaerobic ribonucleoside-triphosphate reductase